jgi:hypothetical protein
LGFGRISTELAQPDIPFPMAVYQRPLRPGLILGFAAYAAVADLPKALAELAL